VTEVLPTLQVVEPVQETTHWFGQVCWEVQVIGRGSGTPREAGMGPAAANSGRRRTIPRSLIATFMLVLLFECGAVFNEYRNYYTGFKLAR
jgi:hypothetical protein